MKPREFYDKVVAMRAAQKKMATTLLMDDIHAAWALEDEIDREIERVESILKGQQMPND